MTRSFSYIGALIAAGGKTHLQNLRGTLSMSLLMALQNLVYLVIWMIFFNAVSDINGWRFREMALLFGIIAFACGLSLFLFQGIRRIPFYIRDGTLDRSLTRPRHPLPSILLSGFAPSSLGDVISGLFCVLVIAKLSIGGFGLFLLGASMSTLIFTATILIFYSLPLFVKGTDALAEQSFNALLIFAIVPQANQPLFIQILMYSVLPAGFMGFLPVELIRGFSWTDFGLLCMGTGLYMTLAVSFFNAGLRRYRAQTD